MAIFFALAALSGCSVDSDEFTPGEQGPSTSAQSVISISRPAGGNPVVELSEPRRYVSVRWTAGGRSGRGRLIARRGPDSKGLYRFRVVLPGAPRGPVDLAVDTYLPFIERATARLDLKKSQGDVRLAPVAQDVPETPGAPRPGTAPPIHVSTTGDVNATGSIEDPVGNLTDALAAAQPGQTILLEGGEYPRFDDTTQRDAAVTIRGVGKTRPTIAGASIRGGSGLHFDHVAFTGEVTVGKFSGASDLEFVDSDFTGRGVLNCLVLRDGVVGVKVLYNRFHECLDGLAGPGPGPQSRDIEVRGNLFEDSTGDGVKFVNWSNVKIERNLIRRMYDPENVLHNDGIQVIGGAQRIRIVANEIHGSTHQLILVQDSVGGPSSDVSIENNLLYDSGSYAMMGLGVKKMRVVHNTAWGNEAGGLALLKGPFSKVVATDTVVANNIIDFFYEDGGAGAAVEERNVFRDSREGTTGQILTEQPGFISQAKARFGLNGQSPARDKASRRYTTREDLAGRPRGSRANIGALE